MEYLVGLIVLLLGGLFFEKSKRKSAEGTLENLETKKQILEVEKNVSKNNGLIEAEKEKREEIKNEKSKKSLDDLARFFNDRK
jgi:hypothetical protein